MGFAQTPSHFCTWHVPQESVTHDSLDNHCPNPGSPQLTFHPLDIYPKYVCPLIGCLSVSSDLLGSRIRYHIPLSPDPPELNIHSFVAESLDLSKEHLPQISVLDGNPEASHPAVVDPFLGPFSGALDDVLGIGGDDKRPNTLTRPESKSKGGNDGAELRSVAGLLSIVAERTLFLQTAGSGKQIARWTRPVPEGPSGSRSEVRLAVV